MDWLDKIPKEPGYYFLDDCGNKRMVEVFIGFNGLIYFEIGDQTFHYCEDLSSAEWLGPIKSEDIINLWKYFNDKRRK